MSDALATYLHDHLGGAQVAIELLEAMRDRSKGTSLSEFAASLLTDVLADRDTLHGVMEKAGSGSNVLKELTGWLAEKATRLKFGKASGHKSGDDFATFEALEFLALGVRGKWSLWRALAAAAPSNPQLSGYDFEDLASRAESQYQRLEKWRLEFAQTALRQPA
jgi:hypothetical protein